MISIGALYIYPIKSCAGISVLQSDVLRRGLAFDRRFMIVDENRHFITQREQPRLALVKTSIHDSRLTFTTDAGSVTLAAMSELQGARASVVVWEDHVTGVACSARASELLSDFLGARVTLMFMPDDAERIVDQRYGAESDIVSFADSFPVLVASRASLDAVNEKLTEKIGMERFRPNIVLEGTRAFEEDNPLALSVQNELPVTLSLVKPCSRCVIVNIDQRTAEPKKEVLATLAKFRARDSKTYFGMNALVKKEGRVAVGDEVLLRA